MTKPHVVFQLILVLVPAFFLLRRWRSLHHGSRKWFSQVGVGLWNIVSSWTFQVMVRLWLVIFPASGIVNHLPHSLLPVLSEDRAAAGGLWLCSWYLAPHLHSGYFQRKMFLKECRPISYAHTPRQPVCVYPWVLAPAQEWESVLSQRRIVTHVKPLVSSARLPFCVVSW